jgi:hypothetical protein
VDEEVDDVVASAFSASADDADAAAGVVTQAATKPVTQAAAQTVTQAAPADSDAAAAQSSSSLINAEPRDDKEEKAKLAADHEENAKLAAELVRIKHEWEVAREVLQANARTRFVYQTTLARIVAHVQTVTDRPESSPLVHDVLMCCQGCEAAVVVAAAAAADIPRLLPGAAPAEPAPGSSTAAGDRPTPAPCRTIRTRTSTTGRPCRGMWNRSVPRRRPRPSSW